MNASEQPLARDGSRSLTEEVVGRLTANIREGVILPGRKLPAESALISRFGVSRTVIREALSRLAAAGLVETHRGKGSFVLTTPSDHAFSLDSSVFTSVSDVVELIDFRLGFEVEAAGLAAARRTEAQVVLMREALHAFRSHRQMPGRAVEADFSFHSRLADATGNHYFPELLAALGPAMIVLPNRRIDPDDGGSPGDDRFERLCAEHEAIVSAVENGDVLAARAAMRLHLANSRDRLRRHT